jgi:hypothetical protein
MLIVGIFVTLFILYDNTAITNSILMSVIVSTGMFILGYIVAYLIFIKIFTFDPHEMQYVVHTINLHRYWVLDTVDNLNVQTRIFKEVIDITEDSFILHDLTFGTDLEFTHVDCQYAKISPDRLVCQSRIALVVL